MLRHVPLRARAFALLPIAALGVHQLRYRLAFGDHAAHDLAAQGHAYLASLAPLLVLAAALGAAEFLARLAGAWRGEQGDSRRGPSFLVLATVAAASLVAIYAGQELLEGLVAQGPPAGLVGVFGDGGWWSLPLAALFGLAIALLLRGADAAVALVARERSARPAQPPRGWRRHAPCPVF